MNVGSAMMAVVIWLQLLAAVAPVLARIDMEFKKYPESVIAPVGDEVTFECEVKVPGEKLSWRWRPADQREEVWKEVPGTSDKESISTRLVVEIREDTPNSLYQCVVWYGSIRLASIPAKLLIAKIDQFDQSPTRRMVMAPPGNTVVLHCKDPVSEPPAILTWWKDTGRGQKRTIDTPHGVLVLHNVTKEDSGTYGCTANNDLSSQTLDLPETTFLRIQADSNRETRFLEAQEYVGVTDKDGVLTMPVRPDNPLRLWCGAVGSPPPRISWFKEGENFARGHNQELVISSFSSRDQGVYSCQIDGAHPHRRSWKTIALEPPSWDDIVASVNASEGTSAHIACGHPIGQPPPVISWLLNAEPLKLGKGITASGSDLYMDRVEKRHAGIVQCFACNSLGCAYDAALLTVVPREISNQDYQSEASPMHHPLPSPRRHGKKNSKKHKPLMVPPSKPNVTRMSDDSVMVSWSHGNHGLPISFYKIQYRVVNNSANVQWHTENYDIPAHIHVYAIEQLDPDRHYKFRVAAVYSNQDNKSGKSSSKFLLRRGPVPVPRAPVQLKAKALSTDCLQLNWTWSNIDSSERALGFYIFYRVLSSAGAYEKVIAPITARSANLSSLVPDTAYEVKICSYAVDAPSDFSSIVVAKTQKLLNATGTTTESTTEDVKTEDRAPGALVTAGGALGATALLVILAVTLLLCRRARRPHANKEKGSAPESGGTNGYIPAKVPMTITANPMHAETGDNGVEMSFLHNNNCGNTGANDDTLPHARKNGSTTRQYV